MTWLWFFWGMSLSAPQQEAPPRPWPSLLGSGLLTLQDTETLAPGQFSVALTIDNRDRDPLGLDLVDGAVAWGLGLTRRAEFYGHHIFRRAVAVPDTPVLPPPPLDLIVAPGAEAPARPYYSLYSPVPYVDDTGPVRFRADVPGEGTMGVKWRALRPRGGRPGLAFGLEVKFPLTQALKDLQAGAGTGGVDVRLRTTGEWRRGGWSLVASSGFTHVGQPAFPDRRIAAGAETSIAEDEDLLLPHRLHLGLGVRRGLGPRLAAVAEATTVYDVGRRTKSLDRARPLDGIGGLQFRWGPLRAAAALRYHGNALPSMATRPSPLAGLVDLTRVSEPDVVSYLVAAGMGSAAAHLRPGSHRLLVPPAQGPPLPAGARVIPPTYRIRSEHQWGFVLLWGWSF
jgi:hypothetical protein